MLLKNRMASTGNTGQPHFRDCPLTSPGADMPKSTRMTHLGHWAYPDSDPVCRYIGTQFPQPLRDQQNSLNVINAVTINY